MIKLTKIILPLLLLCVIESKAQMVASAGIETDARVAGFGGAGVALDANAFSLYRNTAGIIFAEPSKKTAVSYGLSSLYGDNTLHTVGGYYRLNETHALTAGVRYFKADEIQNTNDGLTYTSVKPYDMIIDLGYARKMTDELSLSTNLRYVHSKVNEGPGIKNGKSIALDLGLYYRKDAYSAAVTASNLGMLVDYGFGEYRMPANVKAGGAYRLSVASDHLITGSLEGRYNFMPSDFTFFSGGVGAEYMFRKMVAVRGGYNLSSENKSVGNYGSVGGGVYIGPVVADFSYILAEDSSIMKDVWRVTVGVNF
ncbi:MAG: PorV/PorQ family protein [Dysgonomonas sp.]|nr:PorV/PorQ family protein [Dysgonomonas sp.]